MKHLAWILLPLAISLSSASAFADWTLYYRPSSASCVQVSPTNAHLTAIWDSVKINGVYCSAGASVFGHLCDSPVGPIEGPMHCFKGDTCCCWYVVTYQPQTTRDNACSQWTSPQWITVEECQ